jgi:hypothetical protein
VKAELELAREVARLKALALSRGEVPEKFYRVVPYDGPIWPPCVKRPGRRKRKVQEPSL